jgi:hypothetical protein
VNTKYYDHLFVVLQSLTPRTIYSSLKIRRAALTQANKEEYITTMCVVAEKHNRALPEK